MGTAESRPNCVQVYTGVSVHRGALCRGTGTKRSKFIYLISAPPVVCSACRLIKGRARPPALVVEVGGGSKARRTTDSNLCVIRALGTQSRIRFADYTKTTISRDAVAPFAFGWCVKRSLESEPTTEGSRRPARCLLPMSFWLILMILGMS